MAIYLVGAGVERERALILSVLSPRAFARNSRVASSAIRKVKSFFTEDTNLKSDSYESDLRFATGGATWCDVAKLRCREPRFVANETAEAGFTAQNLLPAASLFSDR